MTFDFEELGRARQEILLARKRAEEFLYANGVSVRPKDSGFYTNVTTLKDLKVAAIMDEFTLYCYQPECNIFEVSPEHFEEELDSFRPDMLFVESAWNGNHGKWKEKIAHGSQEYFSLASYCSKKRIPIVFWNKEDPFHFEDFLIIAQTADFVFTTDSDMIPLYQSYIKSNRIYHLHFAAQPKYHNPIEIDIRQDKFCFAGAYYRCYPERTEIFEKLAQVFLSTKGLVIYDREYGKKRSMYRFPSKYRPYILGSLKADEIEKAYKGYLFGVNMNTVTSSSTMFSRRVFELMASNTVAIGNWAKGLDNYFGNKTICADNAKDLADKLEKYCSTETAIHKYRLLGLREVMTAHLYEDRLNYIVKTIYGSHLEKELPNVTVISHIQSEQEYIWITEMFKSQTYGKKQLLLSYHDTVQAPLGKIAKSGYIAYFHPDNYYAANYLYDLVYALRYCNSSIIGKGTYYRMQKRCWNINLEEFTVIAIMQFPSVLSSTWN